MTEYLLHIRPLAGPPVSINPMNVVLIRSLTRHHVDHTPQCAAQMSKDSDRYDRFVAAAVFVDELCRDQFGCLKELTPVTEILLVNTVGQDSSIQTEAPVAEVEAEWDRAMDAIYALVVSHLSDLSRALTTSGVATN
jgi:hypothetical protein